MNISVYTPVNKPVIVKRFLLIEDHELMRMGILGHLRQSFTGCLVDQAWDEKSALLLLTEEPYDLIICDIHMPDSDIFRLMVEFKVRSPTSPVLVLSASAENVYAKKLISVGARGFVSKNAGSEELAKAASTIMEGRRYMSATLIESISNERNFGSGNPFLSLTEREFQVCTRLLAGISLTTISQLLQISTSTVGTLKARIFEKTNTNSLLELQDIARQYDIVLN